MTKNGMLLVFALVLAVLTRLRKIVKKAEISEAATRLAQYEKELSK